MEVTEKTVLSEMKKASKPVKAGELAEGMNVDKAEVSKIIKILKKDGKIASPKACYYEVV